MANGTPHKNLGRIASIELGASKARAVEVNMAGQETQLLAKGESSLPKQFWQDPSLHTSHLTRAIGEALGNGRISGTAITLTIPRHLVTVRYARLPHASPDQIRGMVLYEAQQYILFPLEEVVLDYCVLPESAMGDEMQNILLVAARRSLIQELIASTEKAGRRVARITVSSLALAEHIATAIEPTTIVHLDSDTLEMVVVANRGVVFSRSTLVGAEAGGRVRDELLRTFVAFQNEHSSLALRQVLVSGEVNLLTSLLTEMVDIPVEPLRVRGLAPNESTTNAIAIGGALQSGENAIASIDLVPKEREELRAEGARRRNNLVAMTVGVAAVLGSLFFVKSQMDAQERDMRLRKEANRDMQEVTDRLAVRKKLLENDKSLQRDLEEGLARKHPVVDVLVALSRALPTNGETWLTQMSAERGGTITLRGDTKSEAAPTEIVLALQNMGGFSDVHLGYVGEAQTVAPKPTAPTTPVTTPQGKVAPLPAMPANKPIPPPTNIMPTNAVPSPMNNPSPPNSLHQPPGAFPPSPRSTGAVMLPPGGLSFTQEAGPVSVPAPPPTIVNEQPIIIDKAGGPRVKQMPPFTALVSQVPTKGTVTIHGQVQPTGKATLSVPHPSVKAVAKPAPSTPNKKGEKPLPANANSKPETSQRRMSFVITFKVNPAVADLLAAPKSKGDTRED